MEQNGASISLSGGKVDQRLTSSIAMTMLLVTLGMLFASLFLGFAVYRSGAEAWPPMGLPRVHWPYPLLSTVVIALSSYTYWRLENGPSISARAWWGGTVILALGFVVAQVVLWSSMRGQGLYASTGIFASLIYAFTWIHAAHIVAGLGVLAWIYPALKWPEGTERSVRLESVGKFWHFLTIVWFLIYFVLFVF